MKILHIVRQFYPCVGGIENYVYNLSKEQSIHGHDVAVLTLNRNLSDNTPLSSDEVVEGIRVRRISFWGIARYPIALSSIFNIKDYDIVNIHCVDFFIDYFVALKFFHKKKIILNTHGGYFHTEWLKLFKLVYFYTVTKVVLHGCDKIIANSRPDYELFSKISNNVIRIDNGVDVRYFSSVNKNIERGSLIYIGRLDLHKRVDNLIRVVAILVKEGISVKLKLVGPDWKGARKKLERLAEDLNIKNSVYFMGYLSKEDLLYELSKAHVFVSASEYEGFGISAIEAMASGTPCVLNNIASFRDFIIDSKGGRLVNFNDFKQSAEIISNVVGMNEIDFNIMMSNARQKAQEYSWEKVSDAVMNVYEGVLYRK